MKLYWTKRGIPHGFLCETPIHLIYRLDGCAPINELRKDAEEFVHQLKGLRALEHEGGTAIQFYDRYVRGGTFWNVLKYIMDNPTKAGLVKHWKDWPLTFVDPRCIDSSRFMGPE